jgi:hypothetical protein
MKPQLVTLSKGDMAEIDAFHKKPRVHRTLAHTKICDGNMEFGWTFEQLGWNMGDRGYVNAWVEDRKAHPTSSKNHAPFKVETRAEMCIIPTIPKLG